MSTEGSKAEARKSSVASGNDFNDSAPPTPDQQKSSVYDFLYHDVRRTASFLSQFNSYGTLQAVKSTESAGRSSIVNGQLDLQGGVPLIAQGKGAMGKTVSDDERDSAERSYDPLWTNARSLLDYLHSNDLIGRDFSKTGIGGFVLLSGNVSIVDLSLFKRILDNDILVTSLKADALKSSVAPSGKPKHINGKKIPTEQDVGMEIIKLFPMSLQGTLVSENNVIWCSLREDCFTISPDDLFLQHGVSLPGNWHVLGILDAKPDAMSPNQNSGLNPYIGGELSNAISGMAPIVRAVLGRPSEAYGITPLMIFRSVSV